MALLETKNLSMRFGGLSALEGVNISIEEGQVFGIIGPNGAGKSTCLNVITGFLKPSEGSVFYKGESITFKKPHEIAEKGIIRTFQIMSLFPDLTCAESVIIGGYLKTRGDIWGAFTNSKSYRTNNLKAMNKANEILSLVGIGDKGQVTVKNLPFGDQRRLGIAIALAAQPNVLLLDEPAAGMSPQESSDLVSLIKSLQKMNISIILVEHNMKVVMELCENLAVLNYGVKIAEGTPEEIVNNEEVVSIYLGNKNEHA